MASLRGWPCSRGHPCHSWSASKAEHKFRSSSNARGRAEYAREGRCCESAPKWGPRRLSAKALAMNNNSDGGWGPIGADRIGLNLIFRLSFRPHHVGSARANVQEPDGG